MDFLCFHLQWPMILIKIKIKIKIKRFNNQFMVKVELAETSLLFGKLSVQCS
jgi:hypothetical protein